MVRKFTLSILIVVCAFFSGSFAQGKGGTNIQVLQAINHDVSIPLKDMQDISLGNTSWQNGVIPLRTRDNVKNKTKFNSDPALQKTYNVNDVGNIDVSFDGVGAQGYAPPDVSGDVGSNHYMEMVNVRFQIWDKTGNSLYGPVSLGTIWSGFPGPWASNLNDGDPVVLYDELADRWLASEFSIANGGNGPEYMLIAISQTPDPTGAWYRYGFEVPQFPDYPKFGVWADGYYMSANRFAPSYTGTYAAAFQRDSMLVGGAANMVLVSKSSSTTFSLLPSDCDGIAPPVGAPNYFVQAHDDADYGDADGLDVFEFHVDWDNPGASTFTGPTFLSSTAFGSVSGVPQQSPGSTLDDISDRLMQRLQYRNFGDHESMVVCQTVNAGSGRAGMRWYEFRNTGSGWSIYQQGTYAPNDGLYRWMGSIAINADGDIALGYSVSGSSMTPEIRFTGRRDGDPLNTMTVTEETIYSSGGVQNGGLSRWGDYTSMNVDPDGHTFWYANEYIPTSGSFNWSTRIASFYFGAPCPIDYAYNPSPVDEATDVSADLSSISWTNGAGANAMEVWFGEAGSMAMVYDGTPVSSWSIPSTLAYSTLYSWKIVEKNDTCNVIGPEWTFTTESDPNIINLFYDTFDGAVSNWNAVNLNDDCDWKLASGDVPNSAFGPPAFPPTASGQYMVASSDACGQSQALNAYLTGSFSLDISAYQSTWIEFDSDFEVYSIPSPPDTAKVQVSIDGGSSWVTVWEHNNDESPEEHAVVDISSIAALQSNVQFRLDYYGDWSWHFAVDNFAVYATSIVPVELTKFTASTSEDAITLYWTTATENNNQGFEIERKSSNGNFSKIGYIPGFGTTTDSKTYSYTDKKIVTGTYTYRLKQIDFNGTYQYSDAINVKMDVPMQYALEQNYPNPFNPNTTIKYSIPEDGFVNLEVFNLLGESVATIVNSTQKAGSYQVKFDASQLSSGIYIYKLKSGNFNSVKKMLLMK